MPGCFRKHNHRDWEVNSSALTLTNRFVRPRKMSVPITSLSNRLLWCYATLAGELATFSLGLGGDVRLLPSEENLPALAIPHEERYVFSGEVHEIRCLIGGQVREELGNVILDAHRIAGPSAVPIGERPVAIEEEAKEAGSLIEVLIPFGVPETRGPSEYLVRIWNESEGKRVLLASIRLHAAPRDYLPEVQGRRIQAVGFDAETRKEWGALFANAGASIEWIDNFPSAFDRFDWIFTCRPTIESGILLGRLRQGQVVVFFDGSAEASSGPQVDRVESLPGKGSIVSLPLGVLTSFSDDATSRTRLLRLLSEHP